MKREETPGGTIFLVSCALDLPRCLAAQLRRVFRGLDAPFQNWVSALHVTLGGQGHTDTVCCESASRSLGREGDHHMPRRWGRSGEFVN
jgi:hypothetical protein